MARRMSFIVLLVTLGFAVLAVHADDFWLKKPDWKAWTKADCKKMLQDSPWARQVNVENNSNNSQLPSVSTSVAMGGSNGMSNAGTGSLSYFVQLRSALPIREAAIRQRQIDKKYDKMTDAQKTEFDAESGKLMNGVPADAIAFHVEISATHPDLEKAIGDYWRGFSAGTVPEDVYLITESGANVSPISFSAAGSDNAFDLAFPRQNGNTPTIAADAKTMKLQFPQPAIGDFPAKKVSAEFHLDKMSWQGKLDY
jgi:hypothetical protein